MLSHLRSAGMVALQPKALQQRGSITAATRMTRGKVGMTEGELCSMSLLS